MGRLLKLFIVFFLFFSFGSINAQQFFEDKISFNSQSIKTVLELLDSFQKKTDLGLIYSNELFDLPYKKSVELTDVPSVDVLMNILSNTGVTFKLIGNEIVLFKEIPNKKFTLNGFVKEQENGEGLIGALISDPNLGKSLFSNNYGFYSITLPPGYHRIEYSYFGAGTQSFLINLSRDTSINVTLETTLTLSEIVITESIENVTPKLAIPSREKVKVSHIVNYPALGGEADLFRNLFLTPGIQSGGDGLGGLFVRGGNSDQNLVLLDGVPVYNSSHILGIFSIFNPESIRSAELIKGGIPARFGGRLSSVLDVRTKEGNEKEIDFSASAGLMSAKAFLEGPIKKDTSSFFLSYRRSLVDLLMKPITKFTNERDGAVGFTAFNFQDINAKVNSKIGNRDRVFFSFYAGGDNFEDNKNETTDTDLLIFEEKDAQRVKWGNTIGSFRWNHIFGNRIFSNTTATFSRYIFNSQTLLGESKRSLDSLSEATFNFSQFISSIEDLAIRQDFDFYLNSNHQISFGLNAIRHRFDPNVISLNENNEIGFTFEDGLDNEKLIPIPKISESFEAAIYVEDEFQVGNLLKANIGLRGSLFRAESKNYINLQPRVAFTIGISETLNLRLAYDRTQQPLHLLKRTGIGLPADLWVPSTDSIAPEKAWQGILGVLYKPSKSVEFGIEAYYKKMENLLEYEEGTNFGTIDRDNWEEQVTQGEGEAKGVEMWVKKETLGKHWNVSGTWVYGTGNGITIPEGGFTIPSNNLTFPEPITVFDFAERNAFRLQDYHRLDIAFNYSIQKGKTFRRLQLGIFNLYNKKNVLFLKANDDGGSAVTDPIGVSILPIIPSISYSFKW